MDLPHGVHSDVIFLLCIYYDVGTHFQQKEISMNNNNGSPFNLGFGVLDNIKKPPRRKKPYAHIYKQPDDSYRFKAIVHEEVDKVPSTRRSFKATIHIIPMDGRRAAWLFLALAVSMFFLPWLVVIMLGFHYMSEDALLLLLGMQIMSGGVFLILFNMLRRHIG